MEKFVVEVPKESFHLWLKACPRTLGNLEPKIKDVELVLSDVEDRIDVVMTHDNEDSAKEDFENCIIDLP
jgi:hypothetical protein